MDTRLRLTITALLSLSPIVPLAARLTHLQVLEHRRLDSRAAGQFERAAQEVAPRAKILDRNGSVLARTVPSWAAFAEKAMIKDPEAAAASLSPLLALPRRSLAQMLKGPGRFSTLKTGLGFEEMSRLADAKIEGVGLSAGQKRIYPNDDLAASLLGAVGSDGRGSAGLELAFNDRLSGRPRRIEFIRDGSGHSIYQDTETEAETPAPLKLTIDRSVQFFAEAALREAAAKFSIRSGLAAVQDPSTGELLALAAYPPTPLKNPLVQDSFEPGSTFKLVTAAAALGEGAVSETETFFCENGSYEIAPGVFIHDHEPEGALTLSGIIQRSSNIGAAKVVERVGAAAFYRTARAFGFANRTGIALPGETAGRLKGVGELNKVSLAASSYGYGVGVNALQLLGAYSAVANGGILYEPSVILDGRKPSQVRRVASERTMARLASILEAAVDRGTGVAARIPGYRVAGKTGTSRQLDPATGRYSTTLYNASFIGFVPASRPALTILVVIDEPKGQYYGAEVAAPVFAKLGSQVLARKAIAPDLPAAPPRPVPAPNLRSPRGGAAIAP